MAVFFYLGMYDTTSYITIIFYFMLEVFDGARLEISELPNPLKSIMLNCVKGEFIQASAKPDILEEQLKQYGLGNLYKYDGEVFKFSFKILNHIIYKK